MVQQILSLPLFVAMRKNNPDLAAKFERSIISNPDPKNFTLIL